MLASVFSGYQALVVLGVVLLLFGNRLPETMRSLGKSVTEFKKGMKDNDEEEPDRLEDKSKTN